ncbi:hypothetical protein JCM5350_001153 [Sporobolomyces pararoseus]
MNQSPCKLLSLPPKLLSDIVDEVVQVGELTYKPICRALLPYQQASLYRNPTRFHLSLERLEQLFRTLQTEPHLGALVKDVDLSAVGPMIYFPRDQIARFLSNLSNVNSLNLGALSGLGGAFRLVTFSGLKLGRLQRLVLQLRSEGGGGADGGNPEVYVLNELNIFLVLQDLDLDLSYAPLSLQGVRPVARSITSLVLRGFVQNDPSLNHVESLLTAYFPSLLKLVLDFTRRKSRFDNLPKILAFTPKNSLQSLSILYLYDFRLQIPPCDHYFAAFPSLTYLYLPAGSFSFDIGQSLAQLPLLRILGFGIEAYLPEDQLEQLAIGQARIRSLEELVLDQVVPDSPQREKIIYGHVRARFDPWQNGLFTMEGVERMVERIRATGIKVTGTTVQAIEDERRKQHGTVEIVALLESLTTTL